MKKLLVLTVLAFLLSVTNLFADGATTISGGTITNQTWTQEGSPYLVEGDIIVQNLVIQPGVRVEFLGAYTFTVTGTLVADAEDSAPILFKNNSASVADWQGIVLDYAKSGCKMINCLISGSANAGMKIINSYPVLENCSVSGNTSQSSGGGMYLLLDSIGGELVLKDCKINNNTAHGHGGGLYADVTAGTIRFENCTINGNLCPDSNMHNYYGGGIYIAASSERIDFINCRISDNYSNSYFNDNHNAYNKGGGIYILSGNIAMNNSIVNSNKSNSYASDPSWNSNRNAYSYGGGIYIDNGSLEMINCIVSNNSCKAVADGGTGVEGGGIYSENGAVNLQNCTIANNEPQGIKNLKGVVTIRNSIVYFNSVAQISGAAIINYTDIQDGWEEGDGNIENDPLFSSTTELVIGPDSPCIDTGDPNPKYNDVCFPLSLGSERNDIGAHGGPGACGSIKYTDSDGDGVHDQWDNCPNTPLNSYVNKYGCPCLMGDINGDGKIDLEEAIYALQVISGVRNPQ